MKNRYRSIRKLIMFVRKKDFPKLRRKAAEIKGFGKTAVHMWDKVMDTRDTVRRRIKCVFAEELGARHTVRYLSHHCRTLVSATA